MPEVSESYINRLLDADENARRILEEAKERGNRGMAQARGESRQLIETTKETLKKNRESLQRQVTVEGEQEVVRFKVQKEKTIKELKQKAVQRHDRVVKELREILFGSL